MVGWDNGSDFPPIFMTLIRGLQWVWLASREGLPFRTPGSIPLFGTYLCSNLWNQFYRTCHIFFSTFHLEYPSVLFSILLTSSLNRLTELNETWQEARSQHSQVCFRAGRKAKMAAQLLIGWDILDLSFETTEQKSTKFEIKQDRNVPLPSWLLTCITFPLIVKRDCH